MSWKQIEWDEDTITIDQAFKTQDYEIGPPKWGKTRVIPMSNSVKQHLQELYSSALHQNANDFVFCYADSGRERGITWVLKNFKTSLSRAGIDHDSRNIVPHSLRHTLNTHLISGGLDPLAVQSFLVWSSALKQRLTAVQTGYTHLLVHNLKNVASSVDNMYEWRESKKKS